MKKTSASAAAPKVHVSELQRRTRDARKRAEAAKKQARDAKQRAREARRLFKEAKRVARKARDELTAFSKKLKKLMGDKLRGRSAKDVGQNVGKGAERAKPAEKKSTRAKKPVKARRQVAAKSEPKKAKPRVAARSAPKKAPASKPQTVSRRPVSREPASRAKGTRGTRRAKAAIPDPIAAVTPAEQPPSEATSQQRTGESTT